MEKILKKYVGLQPLQLKINNLFITILLLKLIKSTQISL